MRSAILVLLALAAALAGCAGPESESRDLYGDDGPAGGNGNDGDEVAPIGNATDSDTASTGGEQTAPGG